MTAYIVWHLTCTGTRLVPFIVFSRRTSTESSRLSSPMQPELPLTLGWQWFEPSVALWNVCVADTISRGAVSNPAHVTKALALVSHQVEPDWLSHGQHSPIGKMSA